jgi:cytochrome c biogenesis protein ResB
VIGRFCRKAARLLGSPRLALILIGFVGFWSLAATAVPQGPSTLPAVAEWTAHNAFLATPVRVIGLHEAFSAPAFIIGAILLALSTAVCSWNRTKVALARSRVLRAAAVSTRESVAAKHDFEVACAGSLTEADVMARASRSLQGLGITTKQRDGLLVAVSPPWSVWGSPLFHWALVLLAVAAFAGVLVRLDGSMAIAVGDAKSDQLSSYRSVTTGPLHPLRRVDRSIRVDSFEPALTKDGLDYGAVPTVSVLDGKGNALVTQPVHANNKLHTGSLSINAPGCGLAVHLELVDPDGGVMGQVVPLVDFSQEATGGTVPVEALELRNAQGELLLQLAATVPLDRVPAGGYGEWIPEQPKAKVLLEDGTGTTLFDGVLVEGQTGALAGGGGIRLAGIGWYSQLSIVDDPSIPFVYASMIAAMLGLTLSLVSRQQLVAATTVEGPDGLRLAMNVRTWRNVPTSREEIERELAAALGSEQEGAVS